MGKHHLPHVCELPLIYGKQGVLDALAVLKSVQRGYVRPATKWDGAPAIKAGFDPDGSFFIAKKSMAQKFKSEADLESVADLDLRHKLTVCFEHLRMLLNPGELPNLRFGDMLYTRNSLALEMIDGKDYFTFTPNTITYAVRLAHAQDSIGNFGFVFHEGWGRHLKSVYQPIDHIWRFKGFEDGRFNRMMEAIVAAGVPDFDLLKADQRASIQKYINHVVRTKPEFVLDADEFEELYGKFTSRDVMASYFTVIAGLQFANRISVEHLNTGKTIGTYLRDESGSLHPCGHEGFVAHGVKFVNRMEFSKANFAKWDKKRNKQDEEVQRLVWQENIA